MQPKRPIYRLMYDLINHISTMFQGIDGETAKDFCWIHGSAYIPPEYQQHMRCIADHTGVERKEDAPARTHTLCSH